LARSSAKPTLAGVRYKQRTRSINVPLDYTSFADDVVAIFQDAAVEGGDVEANLVRFSAVRPRHSAAGGANPKRKQRALRRLGLARLPEALRLACACRGAGAVVILLRGCRAGLTRACAVAAGGRQGAGGCGR
jgi:hypothetical protein